jgi:hypothetical protein
MAEDTGQVTGLSVFEEARSALQDTAKWIVAAAAAVGGVLLAGLQLKDLGSIQDATTLRVAIALGGFGLALFGVGCVLVSAARVLATAGLTLSDLADREITVMTLRPRQLARGANVSDFDPLLRWINNHQTELLPKGITSVIDMRQRQHELDIARAQLRQGKSVTVGDHTYKAKPATIQRLITQSQEYRARSEYLIDAVQLFVAQQAYRRLIHWLWVGGGLIVIGVLTFVFATAKSSGSVITAPAPVNVLIRSQVSTAALRHAGLAQSCVGRALSAMAIQGTYEHPVVVTQGAVGCPPARFKVTDALGLAVPQQPGRSPQTATPTPTPTR